MATWPTITDDNGTNTTGTVINNTNVWTPIQSYIGGTWTNVTYNAANFGTDTGTWTVDSGGDQLIYKWAEVGKTMWLHFLIRSTDVSGSPTRLKIAIPNGRSCVGQHYVPIIYLDAGTAGYGYAIADAGVYTGHIWCGKVDGAAFTTTSSDNTTVVGQIAFEIA